MSFGIEVEVFTRKMKENVNASAIGIATELFTEVIKRTPVGESETRGQLINNWHLAQGLGAINSSYTYSYKVSGINSYNQVSKLKSSQEFLNKDGEVSLTNSTPYGFRAEYAGWPLPYWSGKIAPYAMIRNSLTTVASKYK